MLLPVLPGSRRSPRCILEGGGFACVFSRKSLLGALQPLFFSPPSLSLGSAKEQNKRCNPHWGLFSSSSV